MRTVCLSNEIVQEKVKASFIPLKVQIDRGTAKFPLDWPALKKWKTTYALMGGSKATGITACVVVSSDLKLQLGSTGSAFVWELFDSIAYDPLKFTAMLDASLVRSAEYEKILSTGSTNAKELNRFRHELCQALQKEGRFHLPPRGFTIEGAKELFRQTGDLKDDMGNRRSK